MNPDDVVERINGKALAMGLGEVSVHYRGSTGEMEDLFDISQGKRFTLLARFMHRFLSRRGESVGLTRRATEAPANVL